MTLNVISPELVRTWHERFGTSKPSAPLAGLLAERDIDLRVEEPRH